MSERKDKSRRGGGVLLFTLCVVLVGLFLGSIGLLGDAVPPDPNDYETPNVDRLGLMERDLRRMYERLTVKRLSRRVDAETSERVFREFAESVADQVFITQVPKTEAFRYGEIFRAARQWSKARDAFRLAVSAAGDNEDRRVNDLLRWAHAEAELGQVEEAVRIVRQTFDAPPGNKPPILMGVYLEIVPAARRERGDERLLGRLLLDAMKQNLEAEVVPESPSGQMFLWAQPRHLLRAADLAAELFQASNDAEGMAALTALMERVRVLRPLEPPPEVFSPTSVRN